MMSKEIDPSDIGKHPKLIRIAQNDMTQTDVLVCGKCHCVFHFIELFEEHKDLGCEKDLNMRDCRETKAKVWAFLLWKASQLNSNENAGNINSWKLYQTWVKMEDSIRETWIVAGKTIQSFARMGQGNLQEMPVKITKTVVDNTPRAMSTPKPTAQKTIDNKQIFKKDISTDNEEDVSPIRVEQNRVVRKPAVQFNQTKPTANNLLLTKNVNRRANRTIPNTSGQEFEEETVEKIIAKRFNPRRKMHEYLVKWEGFPHDQNTWEPQTHLESCPQLLDTFEKQLARQKEQRAAQALKQASNQQQQQQQQQPVPTKPTSTPLSPSTGRPARNSKAKAMDQVKQWCADEDSNSVNTSKRKHDDSDFDESAAAGEEDDDNFEDDETPAAKRLKNGNSMAIRMDAKSNLRISQLTTTTIKAVNGTVRTTTTDSPSAEVIITKDSQSSGIVKKSGIASTTTSHKTEAQIRVLSKGENTASGIVRISAINKLPAGGITTGQTRITQITQKNSAAQVRNVPLQRANVNTPTQRPQQRQVQRTIISPNTNQQNRAIINRVTKTQQQQQQQQHIQQSSKAVTPEQKIIQLSKSGDLKVTRKVIHSAPPQATQQQIQKNVPQSELIDDPFPEPQSPPRPLTLCPITGKVLGQAEGEPSPVPSPEPKKDHEINQAQHQQQNLATIGILQTNEHHEQHHSGEELSQAIAISGENCQQLMTNEDGTPLLVTGDDGTIYQVAGENAEGQTILITQGADGEQQYAYVAAEEGDEGRMLTLDNAVAEAVAQMLPEHQAEALAAAAAAGGETQYILKQDDGGADDATDPSEALTIQTGDAGDSQDGNIPAEVVQADLPSPGGTRRVVLLLQDGTFMMTEMQDEEYQALNIVT